MDQQKKRIVNLLLVVDETDNAKVYMHQIISALSSVSHAPTIGRASLLDLEGAKHKILCHKVVFLVDGETQALQYAVKPWVDNLKGIKDNSPKFLVLLNGGLVEDTFGIPKTNIVCVEDLKHFERWWPEIIRFVFKLYKSDLSVYCELKEVDPPITPNVMQHIYTRSKDCLANCNVNISNNEKGSRTVLTCASRGVTKETVVRSNSRVPIRVIAPEDSELHMEFNASDISTYTPVEILKCILLILLDIGMFSRKRECILLCKRSRFTFVLIKTLAIVIAILNLPAYVVYFIPGIFAWGEKDFWAVCINGCNLFLIIVPLLLTGIIINSGLGLFVGILIVTSGFIYFFCWINVVGLIVRWKFDLTLGILEAPMALWKYTS